MYYTFHCGLVSCDHVALCADTEFSKECVEANRTKVLLGYVVRLQGAAPFGLCSQVTMNCIALLKVSRLRPLSF